MASEVKLPRLGQGMESGTVTKWLKNEGDAVEKGEPLYEIDTDKVTQEVESDFARVLLKIALSAGEAPVGQTIAWIGEAGEEIAAPKPELQPLPEPVSDTTVSDTPADAPPARAAARTARRVRVRTGARALAWTPASRAAKPIKAENRMSKTERPTRARARVTHARQTAAVLRARARPA